MRITSIKIVWNEIELSLVDCKVVFLRVVLTVYKLSF